MLMDTMYHAAPDGMAGNEDVGQMSAWLVLSALGFYAVDPVGATYVLGSPWIDHAVIDLGDGARLVIDVWRSSPEDLYLRSFSLNGQTQRRAWFHHADIVHGGHIVLQMGKEPDRDFASRDEDLPPSLHLA